MTKSIEKLAQRVGSELKKHDFKLVTAESCTGGGIGYWITAIPGSSLWFDRGFITYSNTAKTSMLNVSSHTLHQMGSVSEQTAREMAEGALQNSDANVSIAITGIAGPDGGTPEKPIGTVWIAYAANHLETQAFINLFSGNRHEIRNKTIMTALEKFLTYLTQQ
jgi:nicotinamide-nucleotide amidase